MKKSIPLQIKRILILAMVLSVTGIAYGQFRGNIITQPKNVSECTGTATVTYNIVMAKSLYGYTYEWYMAPYKSTKFRAVNEVFPDIDDSKSSLVLEFNKFSALGYLTSDWDRTQFRCVVTENVKLAEPEVSDIAYLYVLTPISISKQPSSAEKNAGESVTFSVTTSGSYPKTYQWQKDEVNILGANSSVYTIASVTVADEGSYRCVVSNPCLTRNSSGATLTVNETLYEAWVEQTSNTLNDIKKVSFTSSTNGWAVVYDTDKLLHTVNGGETWTPTSTELGSYTWHSLEFVNANLGFVGTYANIGRTENGGTDWDRYYFRDSLSLGASPNIFDIFFLDANTGWAVGTDGLILKTTNGGDNWLLQNYSGDPVLVLDVNLYAVYFTDASNGWVVGDNGAIFNTTNGGSLWNLQSTPNTVTLYDVTFTDANNGFAVGSGYRNLFTTSNGGDNWSLISTSNFPSFVPYSVHFESSLDGWAAGYRYVSGTSYGKIARTNDGGITWHEQHMEGGDIIQHIDFIDGENGWAVGSAGTVLRTGTGGCLFPTVNLYGDEALCASSGYTIEADTFAQNRNCSYLWEPGGATGGSLYVTESGEYSVTVTSLCGETAADSKTIEFYDLPVADAGPDQSLCSGDTVQLNVSGGVLFSWSPMGTLSDPDIQNPVAFPTVTTRYYATVTDTNGCVNMDDVWVTVPTVYEGTEICVISVDPKTGKNLVIWEREADQGIDSYVIYRETNIKDEYVPIAVIPFDSLSVYVDVTSNPKEVQHLYKISAIDTCGNESALSPYHKTLLLQYQESVEGVGMRWEDYELEVGEIDFESYVIYRGVDSLSLDSIRTVSGSLSAFTDTSAEATAGKRWYRIAGVKIDWCYPADLGDGKKAGTGPYRHSLSNLDDNKLHGTKVRDILSETNSLRAFPNPFNDKIQVEYLLQRESNVKLEVYNLLGVRILELENTKQLPGVYKYVIRAEDLDGSSIYYLRMTSGGKSAVKKLIPAR